MNYVVVNIYQKQTEKINPELEFECLCACFCAKNVRIIDSIKFAIKCIHNIPCYLLLLSTVGYYLKSLHTFE